MPPGFTITTEVCTAFYKNDKKLPGRARKGRRRRRWSTIEREVGARFGDAEEPAAGLRPLRRPRLHAGHDGHGPQPRPQRRDREGPCGAARATSASPSTATAASSRCIPTSCSAWSTTSFEELLENRKQDRGVDLDTELTAEDWKALVEQYKAAIKEHLGDAVPAGSARAALGRDRRGLRHRG